MFSWKLGIVRLGCEGGTTITLTRSAKILHTIGIKNANYRVKVLTHDLGLSIQKRIRRNDTLLINIDLNVESLLT